MPKEFEPADETKAGACPLLPRPGGSMVSRQEGLAITEDEGELRAAAVEAGVDEADEARGADEHLTSNQRAINE